MERVLAPLQQCWLEGLGYGKAYGLLNLGAPT
jgi:hypothetical protein